MAEQKGQDPLAPFRGTAIHLFVLDRVLLEQLRVIFRALKFTNVTEHKVQATYVESAQQLARLIMLEDGVFLVNPPRTLRHKGGKGAATRDLPDFFSTVSLLVAKARKDEMRTLSKCVPVFADAQFAQKREQTLLSLYKYGISGAFILKKLEPLGSMSPQLKKLRMEEQVMERYAEVREYLEGYLPYREDALSVLKEKREERELSERKAEAEKLMRQGREAAANGEFERAITAYKKAIDLMPGEPLATWKAATFTCA